MSVLSYIKGREHNKNFCPHPWRHKQWLIVIVVVQIDEGDLDIPEE